MTECEPWDYFYTPYEPEANEDKLEFKTGDKVIVSWSAITPNPANGVIEANTLYYIPDYTFIKVYFPDNIIFDHPYWKGVTKTGRTLWVNTNLIKKA
jgi:hypothetical protein